MSAKFIQAVIVSSLISLLCGCENMILLHPKGPVAQSEVNILYLSVALMLIVVVPVIVLSLVFSWRYRESNTKASYKPEWAHSTLLEIICWGIPCIIITILATITWQSSHDLDPFKSIDSRISKYETLKIRVIALDWKWLFIYPQHNVAAVNDLVLPVGVPVEFELTSEGPMNSFIIPQIGGQIYAMAGMRSKLNLIANEIGEYRGFSANFSGEGFSNMKFTAHVTSMDEFNRWVASIQKTATTLGRDEYARLSQPSMQTPIAYYTGVDNYIFLNTVMKKMMPEKDILALCRQNSWV